jgi:hypothetical protein
LRGGGIFLLMVIIFFFSSVCNGHRPGELVGRGDPAEDVGSERLTSGGRQSIIMKLLFFWGEGSYCFILWQCLQRAQTDIVRTPLTFTLLKTHLV